MLHIILTPPTKHLCLEEAGMWCLNGLENGKQVVKRTGLVGHKFLSKKRLVVESWYRDFLFQSIANIPLPKCH